MFYIFLDIMKAATECTANMAKYTNIITKDNGFRVNK